MNKLINLITLPSLILALLVTSGCSAPKPAGLTDQQVTSLTENVLIAIDANDYQNFIQDFSEQMISAFPQEGFTNLRALLEKASGKFVSIGTPNMSNKQGYAVYRFPCKYENETVYVTLTMLIDGQKVEGLFFDSVNLRKSTQ